MLRHFAKANKWQFELHERVRVPKLGTFENVLQTSIFLEVEGAAHYLPAYAGNLDIMTSAALRTGERVMELKHPEVARG